MVQMRGRKDWRALSGAAVGGVVVLLASLLVGSAAASSGSGIATYGPTREWGGTYIRSLDPVPRVPVPSGSSTAPGAHAASTGTSVPADQVLSNETSFTQWAYVARLARIYASPSLFAPVVAHLQCCTESGFPEIYLLLRAHWDTQGREWVQLRIPGRPNGRVGWVLRSALGQFHMDHQEVVVNTETMSLNFYDNGVHIWSAPVGVGKPSTPTPKGHFWISERFVISDPSSGYYPYAFGTTDYSTLSDWPEGGVVGIHGPYGASWSQIPGRISHGCIRLHIPDDFWLGAHLQLGTPVLVR